MTRSQWGGLEYPLRAGDKQGESPNGRESPRHPVGRGLSLGPPSGPDGLRLFPKTRFFDFGTQNMCKKATLVWIVHKTPGGPIPKSPKHAEEVTEVAKPRTRYRKKTTLVTAVSASQILQGECDAFARLPFAVSNRSCGWWPVRERVRRCFRATTVRRPVCAPSPVRIRRTRGCDTRVPFQSRNVCTAPPTYWNKFPGR